VDEDRPTKKRAGRNTTRPELTPREVMFLKSFAKSGNMTTAAMASGSPEDNARQCGWAMMRRIKTKFGEILIHHEVTPDSIIDKVLLPGLEATKIEHFASNGIVMETREVVDHEQRGKFADRIFKLTGLVGNGHEDTDHVPAGQVTVNVAIADREGAELLMGIITKMSANRERPVLDATPHEDEGRAGQPKAPQTIP